MSAISRSLGGIGILFSMQVARYFQYLSNMYLASTLLEYVYTYTADANGKHAQYIDMHDTFRARTYTPPQHLENMDILITYLSPIQMIAFEIVSSFVFVAFRTCTYTTPLEYGHTDTTF